MVREAATPEKSPTHLIDRKRIPIVIRKVASKKWEAPGKRALLVLVSFIFGLGPYLRSPFSRRLEFCPLPRDSIVGEFLNQVFESQLDQQSWLRLRKHR